jgi:hypothetical protein
MLTYASADEDADASKQLRGGSGMHSSGVAEDEEQDRAARAAAAAAAAAAASSSSVRVLAKTFSQQAGRELGAGGGGGVCGGGGEGEGASGSGSCGNKTRRITPELLQKAWGRLRKRACGASQVLRQRVSASRHKAECVALRRSARSFRVSASRLGQLP